MDRFQHMMRTTQHAKSVQMIMTRTNTTFLKHKSPIKKSQNQADNITTYLRKFQINRQNINLAKRIMQCQSQHSKDKYLKQWEKNMKIIKVRSNFKKTLHAKQPIIYKFQPIIGKGKLKIQIDYQQIQVSWLLSFKKILYKFVYILGSQQIQPDQKFITLDYINQYSSSFYAPSFLKKKKITCKILQINQNNCYEVGRFCIDLQQQSGDQNIQIFNKLGKSIGKINFHLKISGGRKKKHKKPNTMMIENSENKQNQFQNQKHMQYSHTTNFQQISYNQNDFQK